MNADGISRRELLKLIGAGTSLMLGARLGIDKLLSSYELGKRKSIFDELYINSYNEEGKRTLKSWLKFNVAEAYAASQGLELTAETNRRFIIGDGSPWDITDALERHIMSKSGPYEVRMPNEQVAWGRFYEDSLQSSILISTEVGIPHDVNPDKSTMRRKLNHGKEFEFIYSGSLDSQSTDMYLALTNSVIKSEGTVSSSNPNESGWTVFQRGGVFSLHDRHDWNPNQPGMAGGRASVTLAIESVLQTFRFPDGFGIMIDIMGEENYNKLDEIELRLDADDALPLQEKGLLHPFDIYTRTLEIQQNIQYEMPFKFLRRPSSN